MWSISLAVNLVTLSSFAHYILERSRKVPKQRNNLSDLMIQHRIVRDFDTIAVLASRLLSSINLDQRSVQYQGHRTEEIIIKAQLRSHREECKHALPLGSIQMSAEKS